METNAIIVGGFVLNAITTGVIVWSYNRKNNSAVLQFRLLLEQRLTTLEIEVKNLIMEVRKNNGRASG